MIIKKLNIEIDVKENVDINNFGHIYLFNNLINNKKYIGQSVCVRERIIEHIRCATNKKDRPLYKALNKYGFNNFEYCIIDSASDMDELNQKEIYYINLYKSNDKNLGYNIEAGGRNSLASPETKLKLSEARHKIKQSSNWIKKRVDQVSKPVIKLDRETNIILEKYSSLADAGRNNTDGYSYGALLRMCLGKQYNSFNSFWCYKKDYVNNTFNEYNPPKHKAMDEFSDEELNMIFIENTINNVSIRELSRKYNIYFSTIHKYITEKLKPESCFKENIEYNAICKKTGKRFADYLNVAGALTIHVQETYPDVVIETLYKRKQIELKTGKPWYYEYFDFIEV
jgi:group I intron endonuclease